MTNQDKAVRELRLGLIQAERNAICEVYPAGWRNQSPTHSIDRLVFVDGLRLLGLTQTQREAVMREFNTNGAFAARLEAGKYLNKSFEPLFTNS